MSKLLEEVFAKLADLPAADQDSIATWLLAELDSERQWETLLSESREALGGLADEALAEHERGHTKELDSDTL